MKTVKTHIVAIGRRWCKRAEGTTYHSCEVYVDGKLIERVPYAYGYGRTWEQTAMDILVRNGVLHDSRLYPWTTGNPHYRCIISVTDVCRKSDL